LSLDDPDFALKFFYLEIISPLFSCKLSPPSIKNNNNNKPFIFFFYEGKGIESMQVVAVYKLVILSKLFVFFLNVSTTFIKNGRMKGNR